ncbi:MAG TPA: GNAT family protein [candidate division Zixibacteria bacterium]|nr:GNAT family protein [candidate division Zixibacteria bacterium]
MAPARLPVPGGGRLPTPCRERKKQRADEREKGYASDAMGVLCRYLFKFRGLNKVHAQTAEFNKGAIRLLGKLGFKRDGVLRDHYYHAGEFHAGYIYSLLAFELD